MKMVLVFLMLFCTTVYAGDNNVGFLMNQKYVCIHQGALMEGKIVPLMSKEDALKHPMRIVVDDNNLLQTDGPIKNLKHIADTVYGSSDHQIILKVMDGRRFIVFLAKEMGDIPVFSLCEETDHWTIAK